MASEIALECLNELPEGAVVCDPMSGSGTVASIAVRKGLRAIAFDLDPLAALITSVRCTSDSDIERVRTLWDRMRVYIDAGGEVSLPWIDSCKETKQYTEFWFGPNQLSALRRAARFLSFSKIAAADTSAANVLRLALSRIIIQKTSGASLAWDASHSRPHIVHDRQTYDYDVAQGLAAAVSTVSRILERDPPMANARVRIGDARLLRGVKSASVDAIVTSPPYLNAIDYLRGHRLSLVWLGLSIPQLRAIRGASVGAESAQPSTVVSETNRVMTRYPVKQLSPRQAGIVHRYASDLVHLTRKAFQVLKPGGIASYVIGDNVLTGVQLKNSSALVEALELAGFEVLSEKARDIPAQHRYLPVNVASRNALNNRMRQEIVVQARRSRSTA